MSLSVYFYFREILLCTMLCGVGQVGRAGRAERGRKGRRGEKGCRGREGVGHGNAPVSHNVFVTEHLVQGVEVAFVCGAEDQATGLDGARLQLGGQLEGWVGGWRARGWRAGAWSVHGGLFGGVSGLCLQSSGVSRRMVVSVAYLRFFFLL